MQLSLKLEKYLKNTNMSVLVFLAILFNIFVILNTLQSDYFGDDLYNFQVPGLIPFEHPSISSYTLETIKGWMDNGRLFPAGFYSFYVYDILDSILLYKGFILLLIVLNVATFSYLVYILSKSKALAVIVLLITPILFQYRYYHDPILSFHGLMQMVFLYTVLSLIFLERYIYTNKIRYYALSLLFYTLNLLTYEISYAFILMYIPIILSHTDYRVDIKRILKILSPYFIILVSLVLYTLYLRVEASIEGGPYLINWDIGKILKVYFYQVISVLPLTYYLNFGDGFSANSFNYLVFIASVFVLAYVFLNFEILKNDRAKKQKQLFFLSALILLLPGMMISLSTKFQGQGSLIDMNTIQFGLPYIPIYIQTFGLSLLVSLLIYRSSGFKQRALIMFVLLMVLMVHFVSNNQVISKVNAPYKNAREVLTLFFSSHLKDKLHDGDAIRIVGESLLHSKSFVSMIVGKDVSVSSESNAYSYQIQYDTSGNAAVVSVDNMALKESYVILYQKENGDWQEVYNEKNKEPIEDVLIQPVFNNFYPWEGVEKRFRWAKPNPSMLWVNPSSESKVEKLTFIINSLNARSISIILNGNSIFDVVLKSNKPYLIDNSIKLQPGKNIIEFETEEPAVDPHGPDNRSLLFSIEKVHPITGVKNDSY